MKKQTNTNTHPTTPALNTAKTRRIKLGIDMHADGYHVVRQFDHATPQPARTFTPRKFLLRAQQQLALAEEVHSGCEAGPFGYGLRWDLIALGIHNCVIRPQDCDELHKGVNTDKTDALALLLRLNRLL